MLAEHAGRVTSVSFVEDSSATKSHASTLSILIFLRVGFVDWLCHLGHVTSLFCLSYLRVYFWRRRLTLTRHLTLRTSLTLNDDVAVWDSDWVPSAVVNLLLWILVEAVYSVLGRHTLELIVVSVTGSHLVSTWAA